MGETSKLYEQEGHTADWKTLWFRSLGWLPLILFAARLVAYYQIGQTSQMLWMCHLANLLLAAGLFLASPPLIRLSVVLIIFGIIPWIVDMFVIRIVTPVSLASHLGGVVVGLLAISRVRAQKWSWLAALGAFVLLQIFCRLFTPAEFNINTAHRVYDIWKDTIGSYRLYWILSISVIAVTLWAIDSVLLILFPQGKPWTAHYWDKENAELTKYDKTNAQRHDR